MSASKPLPPRTATPRESNSEQRFRGPPLVTDKELGEQVGIELQEFDPGTAANDATQTSVRPVTPRDISVAVLFAEDRGHLAATLLAG